LQSERWYFFGLNNQISKSLKAPEQIKFKNSEVPLACRLILTMSPESCILARFQFCIYIFLDF
jgi:hypothetical protein